MPWVTEAVEAKAYPAEDVTVSVTGAEEQASAQVSRHAANVAAVAAYLACHPRVGRCAIRASRRIRVLRAQHRSWWADLAVRGLHVERIDR